MVKSTSYPMSRLNRAMASASMNSMARAGINDYVVPGNKPDVIKQIREVVEAEGATPVFYAPGFIAQGGVISEAANIAGKRFHGIVGRGIYDAQDMKTAALEHTSQLR